MTTGFNGRGSGQGGAARGRLARAHHSLWYALVAGTLLIAASVLLVRAAARSTPPDFIAYLTTTARGVPALVAFNPSAYAPGQDAPRLTPLSEIIKDLKALRPAFDGLVLYAYEPQLTEAVVGAAADLGFRAVLLGIWDPRSAVEIEGVAGIARRFADRLALAVVIGNEGINDNRYTLDDVVAAAEHLRHRLPAGAAIPMTTSEPWGDYGWPPLNRFGDFLSPNIHPALDRPALTPEAAAAWARARAKDVARVTGRSVLVKETGWPHAGGARFSPEAQAAFWAAWLAEARLAMVGDAPVWVSYAAAFEAFDAPWKAAAFASGIEGHWGLLGLDRTPYPAFALWSAQR
jgi:exo-beta-1,3-glucanase (GH17 family)